MNTFWNVVNVLGLLAICVGLPLSAWYNRKAALSLARAATATKDATSAMVIAFADNLIRFESMLSTLAQETAADRGRDDAPTPPRMPVLASRHRHAADPSGEYDPSMVFGAAYAFPGNGSGLVELREALHSNKVTYPPIVEECFLCACTLTGWSGPHCHYHQCSIPQGNTGCPYYVGGEGPIDG